MSKTRTDPKPNWGQVIVLLLTIGACLLAAAGTGYFLGYQQVGHSWPLKLRPNERVPPRSGDIQAKLETQVVFRTHPQAKLVALTFDDGPDEKWTPRVLEILQRHQAKATFFQVGSAVQAHPEITRQLARAGMEIGVHEWQHIDVTTQGYQQQAHRLERSVKAIEAAGAQRPRLYRPPYGRIDTPALFQASRLNLQVVMWSHLLGGSRLDAGVKNIYATASNGMIILSHDGRHGPNEPTMRALDEVITKLQSQGFKFVTVSTLLAASDSV